MSLSIGYKLAQVQDPRRQKLHKMLEEKVEAAKAEVQ
jgi:hypothetical protein